MELLPWLVIGPYPPCRTVFYLLEAKIFRIGVSWATDETFFNLFIVTTGTLNIAQISNIYTTDMEFNSMYRIYNWIFNKYLFLTNN